MSKRPYTLLLVEDDKNLSLLLAEQLEDEGFKVIVRRDGVSGLKAMQELHFDLCILDIMLPQMDGLELSGKLLEMDRKTPFIFLTARALKSDRIMGYKAGADDYVSKPFDTDELVYKIKAILRRTYPESSKVDLLEVGCCQFHIEERRLETPNKVFQLSNKESGLIRLFFESPNTPIPKSTMLKTVWGRDDYFTAKSMEVYLTKVRKYLKEDARLELQNLHGYGYKLIVHPIENMP